MSRPRAGHGWTCLRIAGKRIDVMLNDAGRWITTGEAVNWPRCSRCRRPFEQAVDATRPDVCGTCFYYHIIPKETFWDRKADWHFPYSAGRRGSDTEAYAVLRRIHAGGPTAPWRRLLREHRNSHLGETTDG